MTIRDLEFSGTMTHAGPASELAALALKYAAGQCIRVTEDQKFRFEIAAKDLGNGRIPAGSDGVRFWPDHADGSPFNGNRHYRPEPDKDSLRAHPEYEA